MENVNAPLQSTPRSKRNNKVSFRTIKYSSSRNISGRTDSNSSVDVETINDARPIKNSESLEIPPPEHVHTNDWVVLRTNKPAPEGSKTCKPRFDHEEVLFLEDIYVVGEQNDDAALELESYEWVPLNASFRMSDDQHFDNMKEASKKTDASLITLDSEILPPKFFYDRKKNSYFILDGVHRLFFLRNTQATHILALVSSVYDISYMNNQAFWEKNFVVDSWNKLRAKLYNLAQENQVKNL